MADADALRRREANEAIEGGATAGMGLMTALFEISNLLHTGLDKHALSLCVSLIERGVDPSALAVSGPVASKLTSGCRPQAAQWMKGRLDAANTRIACQLRRGLWRCQACYRGASYSRRHT